MLVISDQIQIPDSDYSTTAVRSQGAGGQNVNKVATAIQLRFDISQSSLPDTVKTRLLSLHDQRVSADGIFIIKAQEFRSQTRNLNAAKARLVTFIRRGLRTRKRRVPTKPSKAVVRQRLENKRRRGQVKASRGKVME